MVDTYDRIIDKTNTSNREAILIADMVLEEEFPKLWEVWEGDNEREHLEKSGWSKQD